jgi:hypothetical protein
MVGWGGCGGNCAPRTTPPPTPPHRGGGEKITPATPRGAPAGSVSLPGWARARSRTHKPPPPRPPPWPVPTIRCVPPNRADCRRGDGSWRAAVACRQDDVRGGRISTLGHSSSLAIPGRRREAEASPESIIPVRGYGFRALGLRPRPGMTFIGLKGRFRPAGSPRSACRNCRASGAPGRTPWRLPRTRSHTRGRRPGPSAPRPRHMN